MSQVVGLDMVTGMGFIGLEPGRLYKIGQSPKLKNQTASGNPLLLNSAEAPLTSLTLYGWSKQDGTPSPENPVPIVSAGSVMTTGAQLVDVFNPDNWVYNAENGAYLTYKHSFPAGTYTVSMSQNNVTNNSSLESVIALYIGSTPGVTSPNKLIANSNSTGTPLTTVSIVSNSDVYINLFYDHEQTSLSKEDLEYIFSLMPEFMFNAGDTALPWEPYTGGQPAANPYEGEINVTVQGGNLFEDYGKKISVSPSSDYYISTGETDAKRIDLACYDEQMQLVTEGGLSQIGTFYLQSNGTYRLSSDLTNINTPIVTGENTKYVEFIIPSFQTDGFPNLMLNTGSTPLPYQPYKTPQTLTAQTPGGLAGIPVSSGGNYTDESGQQWICDEVDFKRGKYVQRVWRKTFDGTESWITYGTPTSVFYGFMLGILPESSYRKSGFCNQFIVSNIAHENTEEIWLGANNEYIYCVGVSFYDASLPDYGLSNWKAHLAAHPLEVMTYLETPIETDLSDEEMAAYKALHTYTPNTTVSNDADVWMGVGYKK